MSYRKKKLEIWRFSTRRRKLSSKNVSENQFIVVFFLIKLKTSVNLLKKKKLLKYKLLKSKKLDQITP